MSAHETRLRGFAPLRRAIDIVGQAALAWIQHDASTMGAALAFYTVFSVAPILIIAIGVLGFVVGGETVQAGLLPQMQILFGDAGASAVQTLLLGATHMGKNRVATFIGAATLLIGASSVFVELQNSLDRIWGVPARSRMSGFWQFVRARFLSLGLVFGVGFLLMVSLLVSTVLAALNAWIASFLGEWPDRSVGGLPDAVANGSSSFGAALAWASARGLHPAETTAPTSNIAIRGFNLSNVSTWPVAAWVRTAALCGLGGRMLGAQAALVCAPAPIGPGTVGSSYAISD